MEVIFPKCYTDKLNCCRTTNEGHWSYPPNITSTKFSVNRNDQGSINLKYNDNEQLPGGTYCCMVPNADDLNQMVCVNTG